MPQSSSIDKPPHTPAQSTILPSGKSQLHPSFASQQLPSSTVAISLKLHAF